ncbi:histone acetyltransferase [Thecamonas trahens ATCC 50062]|uniref:Histone acetyltransferase n=1 Tax=Thecamonas trahens ATCC 50062 TaxID=461836 RepID=A0A0L0DC38_THETB|nr:histone acetyltransferase [Thecamonas trahens ATCC 50062]KNC49907.1 histone acetyltransferase [Thecamonas trahens ATCC 50062]|eukprot:XP_013757388.1 histone acetyltransferase [Thecamonas trahens ATCC 50062]
MQSPSHPHSLADELLASLSGPAEVYLYAPKDDAKHRALWSVPYSSDEAAAFTALAAAAPQSASFVYALAPGLAGNALFADPASAAAAADKVAAVFDAIATAPHPPAVGLAVLFDDIPVDPSPAVATAQAAFAAALIAAARDAAAAAGLAFTFAAFCPTVYCARMAAPFGGVATCGYLAALAEGLPDDVHVFWTGNEIVSPSITAADLAPVNAIFGRKVLLWDNVFANDYDNRRAVLGPIAGRPLDLRQAVAGLLINPNTEYEFNYVPLVSLRNWLAAEPGSDAAIAPSDSTHLDSLARDWLAARLDVPAPSDATVDALVLLLRIFAVPADAAASLDPILAHPTNAAAIAELKAGGQRLVDVYEALHATLVSDAGRALLYALHPYMWELKEAGGLLLAYAAYLCAPVKASLVEANAGWPFHTSASGVFFSDSHALPTYEATLAAQIKSRLLTLNFADASIGLAPPDARGRLPRPRMDFVIRTARPADVDACYLVCLETGNYGDDGTEFYLDDPLILGHRYTGPYLEFDETAYVLEDEAGVCGYTLGVLDSNSFWARYLAEWVPKIVASLPAGIAESHAPGGALATPVEGEPRSHELYRHFLNPPTAYEFASFVDEYPSHLHIDIIARGQSQGQGTRLIKTLLSDLRARGSTGVHLEMAITNDAAYGFYRKLGFVELFRNTEEIVMGIKL